MTEAVTIKLDDADLQRVLKKVRTVAEMRGAVRGLRAGAAHYRGKIAKYPAASIANSPSNPRGRWYERGYGQRWKKRDGTVAGSRTSQMLGRLWAQREQAGGMQQVVGNRATYAVYVHSSERQVGFHQARGWKNEEQVWEEEKQVILDNVVKEIRRELLTGG
jgi:hypothetical protein